MFVVFKFIFLNLIYELDMDKGISLNLCDLFCVGSVNIGSLPFMVSNFDGYILYLIEVQDLCKFRMCI